MFDPLFAYSGDWYGTEEGLRGGWYTFLPISVEAGNEFAFSFWARIPSVDGFEGFTVSMQEAGFTRIAAITALSTPELSDSEWRFFSYRFVTPEDWLDSGNTRIGITLPNGPTARTIYIDEITLTQIPEPGSVTLIAAGLLAAITLRRAAGRGRKARA